MHLPLRLPRIDVDALVIQHLFQPVVDWLGIDPERWAWKLYRAFVMTMVTAGAALIFLSRQLALGSITQLKGKI